MNCDLITDLEVIRDKLSGLHWSLENSPDSAITRELIMSAKWLVEDAMKLEMKKP